MQYLRDSLRKRNNKGQVMGTVSMLLGAVIGIIVLGLVLAYGQDITSDIGSDFSAGTYEKNSTDKILEGNDKIAQKIPTINNVIVAVAIIGLLVGGFGAFANLKR